jgi:hypothetical protein
VALDIEHARDPGRIDALDGDTGQLAAAARGEHLDEEKRLDREHVGIDAARHRLDVAVLGKVGRALHDEHVGVDPEDLLAEPLLKARGHGEHDRERGGAQRDVLDKYDAVTLKRLMMVLAAFTIGTYAAYTQSSHAQSIFGTRALAITIPFVLYGIFRFLWLVTRKMDDESPTDSLLRDTPEKPPSRNRDGRTHVRFALGEPR